MVEQTKLFINGEWVVGEAGTSEKRSQRDGRVLADVGQASAAQVERAVEAAYTAFRSSFRKAPAYQRYELLSAISRGIGEHAEEFVRLMAEEVGKPRGAAQIEVARAQSTFLLAAEEAKRIYGETVPLDLLRGSEERIGLALRQPIGVVAAITPFNFPLNLVAHKVAPALAVGNTVVLRPTTEAPLTALKLAEIIEAAGAPAGVFNIVPCSTDIADVLLTSERVAMISFTGSGAVGRHIRQRAGMKRVALELGSNAANIVTPTADLTAAAAAIARGGFAFAGQSCISAQRIYVHESVYDSFLALLASAVRSLKVGDPLEDGVDVGPMISQEAAARAESWIREAASEGAHILVGGARDGAYLSPAVLTDVTERMRVVCEEVFAPVVAAQRYADFREMIEEVNRSRLGLNHGIFTRDLAEALYAIEELEVGAVIVNDVSTYRADHMPYGGVKESGAGREGLRYAMQEMTELKFAVLNPDFRRLSEHHAER
jgi:acyl-CoA reductase-like NAD-dependent aldehyde dehydrogenase